MKTTTPPKFTVLLIASLLLLPCHAQEAGSEKDPYKAGEKRPNTPSEVAGPINLSMCYETFSLDLGKAAGIQRERLPDEELYARMIADVKAGEAKQESFVVIRGRSGEKFTSEAVSENIHPTEYEPAETPTTVGVSIIPGEGEDNAPTAPDVEKLKGALPARNLGGLNTPATPTAFQTQNVGLSFEAEMILSENETVVDLRVLPTYVTDVGRSSWGQGISVCETPVYEKQSLNTAVTVRAGQPFLLGTMNRPSVSKVDPDSANRVWFAFVTVSLQNP